MAAKYTLAIRNADLDTRGALLDGGTIKLYTGTRPATPDVAVTDQVLIATMTFSDTAFAPADGGQVLSNTIIPGVSTVEGTVTWARLCTSGGTAVCDIDVGTSGADLILANTHVLINTTVNCSSLTITEPS